MRKYQQNLVQRIVRRKCNNELFGNQIRIRHVPILDQAKNSFSTNAATAISHDETFSSNSNSHSTSMKNSTYIQGTETHFGFQSVNVNEKEGRVKQVFESVADSYDIMNDLMSGGLHRYWKDQLLDMSAVTCISKAIRKQQQQQGQSQNQQGVNQSVPMPLSFRILDVAGGTGDVAFRFIEAAECPERANSLTGIDPINVTICDINPEMLRVGEARAMERYGPALLNDTEALSFVEGNAQNLEFADNSYDLYTIAFGLRNVTDVDKALAEAYRVLKPGGRFMCLEFSQVPDPILRQIYDVYSFNIIPEIGEFVANDRASYQYLVESIRKFSNQEELLERMDRVGFQLTKYTNMTGGIVAVHEGWKPL